MMRSNMLGSHWSWRFRAVAGAALGLLSLGAACPNDSTLGGFVYYSANQVAGIGEPSLISPQLLYDAGTNRHYFRACRASNVSSCTYIYNGDPRFAIIVAHYRRVNITPVGWPPAGIPGHGQPAPPPAL